MNKIIKGLLLAFLTILLCLFWTNNMDARTKEKAKGEKDEVQARLYTGLFDVQFNTVSNISFPTSNYGIFGLDVARNRGGGFWPRGSQNEYIFGGGIWFAARKYRNAGDTIMKKYCEVSYNPNNGRSWMVPGRIEDGLTADQNELRKYRTYFSTDFRRDGTPLNSSDGPNWPIWDSSTDPKDTLKNNRYFGNYVQDITKRNVTDNPKGAAFISGEDIVATFKDTDLNYYDGGLGKQKSAGYPLYIQYVETIYSWGFGDYRDFIFIKYDMINYKDIKHNDTLWNCWLAPVLDIDIAIAQNSQTGASNDRTRYFNEDTTLNLAFQWSGTNYGEKGRGFGYLGFDFLESPAVIRSVQIDTSYVRDSTGTIIDTIFNHREIITDSTNFVRKDSAFYANSSQLGLVTFRNWNIEYDPLEDEPRYDFISAGIRDGDTGEGDKRFMMATGPFNIRPGDTVRTVVGIILANAAVKPDPDGSTADVQELIRKDKFAQKVYDENFKAPQPPDLSVILSYYPDSAAVKGGSRGLNNAIKIKWDTTAELSDDKYERGLDFLGYKLYRARRSNLDTFNIDEISKTNEHPSGAGPLGWKQVAQWQLPTPFKKSIHRGGKDAGNLLMPFIDSLRIIGPYTNPDNTLDSFAIRVMRIGQGVVLWKDSLIYTGAKQYIPVIWKIDTALYSYPWGPYYSSFLKPEDFDVDNNLSLTWRQGVRHNLLDSILIGKLELNSSLLEYNPLLFKYSTINIPLKDTTRIPSNGIIRNKATGAIDTIYLKSTYREGYVNGTTGAFIDVMLQRGINQIMNDSVHVKRILDSIYKYIQMGYAKVTFPEFETKKITQDSVIIPYMNLVTNNHTYIDFGDDNRDGVITYDPDPTKTEKIINNVEYNYKVIAYDEGDYNQPTPTKQNNGNVGNPNVITAYAKSAPASNLSELKIIYVDSAKIGGLYNFKFYALDQDRVNQMLSGDTLELEIQPYWNLSMLQFSQTKTLSFGMYYRRLTIKDITKNTMIMNTVTPFEASPCSWAYRGGFTEQGSSWVLSDTAIVDPVTLDTNSFGTPYNEEKVIRSGTFTTGDFTEQGYCYTGAFYPDYFGILGLSFDYSLQQWGGNYRPDSTTAKISGDAVTPVTFITFDDPKTVDPRQEYSLRNAKVFTTQSVDTLIQGYWNQNFYPIQDPILGSFNNGPANLEVEFTPGGQETMTLIWGRAGKEKTNTFNVNYLNMKVRNVLSYNRPTGKNSNDSVAVTYPEEWQPIALNTLPGEIWPTPLSLKRKSDEFINKYNVCSFGFVDHRYNYSLLKIPEQFAMNTTGPFANKKFAPIGSQNKYYLSAISVDGVDTLDFVNMVTASSVQFVFDYPNKARARQPNIEWGSGGSTIPIDQYSYGPDFKPGDKVMLKTFGGALGLPLPGAKVRCVVSNSTVPMNEYTDAMMDQINVVPNPYYISHEGQKSPYDGKIYFTKLPKQCTIEIYTINGDLIRSINHDEVTSYSPDQEAIGIWDLQSSNKQRVESQTLVALIKAPNGAQSIKKFSLVVGGFRLISE